MYCKHCGANIPDGSVFCKHCGGKQDAAPVQQAYASQQQVYTPPVGVRPKKNIGLIITVCVLGVAALVAIVLIIAMLTDTPKTYVSGFSGVYEELIEASDIGTAGAEAYAPVSPGPTQAPTQMPADVPTAAPTMAPTMAPTVAPTQMPVDAGGSNELDAILAAGLEQDIEEYLDQTWWASSGYEIDNPYAETAAPGYPVVYDLEFGEVQYIFDADTQTVTSIYEDADGELTQDEWDYTLDPSGFYLFSFHRTRQIEGVEYEIYSVFFASGGVLYEFEAVDDIEASNIIELTPYGP